MNDILITHKIPTGEILLAVVNPRNEPVRIVPIEDYTRYHQENFIQDGNFCYVEEDKVVAALHYPYACLIIHTTDNLKYQLTK